MPLSTQKTVDYTLLPRAPITTYHDSSIILFAHLSTSLLLLLLFFPFFVAAAAAVALALAEVDLLAFVAAALAVLVVALLTAAAAPSTFETARVCTGEALVVIDTPRRALAAARPFTASVVPCCWFAATAMGRSIWFCAIWAFTAESDWEVVTGTY
jgi:hypothetical protein